jgi:hypothetical protein
MLYTFRHFFREVPAATPYVRLLVTPTCRRTARQRIGGRSSPGLGPGEYLADRRNHTFAIGRRVTNVGAVEMRRGQG